MAEISSKQDEFLLWNYCPSEILYMIFKKLDNKSLLACWSVSKEWRAIIDNIVQYNRDWAVLAKDAMVNAGATFEKQTKLGWRDIYVNSLLWQKVKDVDVLPVYTYKDEILNVNVYKDNLIVVLKETINYYDLETHVFKKQFKNMAYVDFNENDYMFAFVARSLGRCHHRKGIYMYRKATINDDSLFDDCSQYLSDMEHYILDNKTCHVIAQKNLLWDFTLKGNRWNGYLRARYFGDDSSVLGMNAHRGDIYVLLATGHILFNDNNSMYFTKVYAMDLPAFAPDMPPLLFKKYSVVFGMPSDVKRIKLNETSFGHTLECPGLCCCTEHGDILFLGFETGKVHICIPDKHKKYVPELIISISELDDRTDDLEITSLNVYEAKHSHHLLIGTDSCVYQLQLLHRNVDEYY